MTIYARSFVIFALILGGAICAAADATQEKVARLPSQYPEPGLTLGECHELPLPKTLLYSAGPDAIISNAEEWKRRGIDGFFLSGCVGEWSDDIWATDGKPWTIGESDKTFQKAKRAGEICRRIGSEMFLRVTFNHYFEWFNDTAWQRIYNNFRQFAIFARDTGCTGVGLDIEYVYSQYFFTWEGYDYNGYTRRDLVKKVRERMTDVARAMYDEFPEMTLLTLPELEFTMGGQIQAAWVEEAARRNAPGGIHYCMGYTYRNYNIRYVFARAWLNNTIFQKLLSARAKKYWMRRCTNAPGVWPFGMPEYTGHGPELTPEQFREGMASSRMIAARYMWIFGGDCQDQLLGRHMEKYRRKENIEDYVRVMAGKEIVTTPKYLALAKEIRKMKLRDYSKDLGILLEPGLRGPGDMPVVRMVSSSPLSRRGRQALWDAVVDRSFGRTTNLARKFGTRTHWMLIGPFPNEGVDLRGHNTVYPPEESIDLNGQYDGVDGKVKWFEHRQDDGMTSVDLTKLFKPKEHVCAYALCYVTSRKEVEAQVRLSTNDSGKLWIGDKLVFDYPQESAVYLDEEIIPVTLPKGTTPILFKVCNGEGQWGFVFRVTDVKGQPLKELSFSVTLPI